MADLTEQFSFACCCGTRLSARLAMVGHRGRCKVCGAAFVIPTPESPRLSPPSSQPRQSQGASVVAVQELCSICQTAIETDESKVDCDACGLPFHEDCWRENRGCSAYGCVRVNVLRTGPDIRITEAVSGFPVPPFGIAPPPIQRDQRSPFTAASIHSAPTSTLDTQGIPWEFALIAASVLGILTCVASRGVLPLMVAIIAFLYAMNTSQRPNKIALTVCFILCGLGTIAGLLSMAF
jgi:hypothetical protein